MKDFSTFWENNYNEIKRRCARIVGPEEAEDLLIEAWIKCRNKNPDTIENWWAYVTTVCKNIANDWYQEKEKQKRAEERYQSHLPEIESERRKIRLLFGSGLLSQEHQTALELEMDNKTREEIASEMKVTIYQTRKLLNEAYSIARNFFQRLK
jgi:RNA polymerase sigma factor (sigma-70 family)